MVVQSLVVGSSPKTFVCLCDCGGVRRIAYGSLRQGYTRSCGCLRRETTSTRRRTHGGRYSAEYRSLMHAIDRCENPNSKDFKDYGGRGITMCDRWRNSFANFIQDMGPRPGLKFSIGRINNNGNYEPGNCRWETQEQQSNNTQRSRFVNFRGQILTLAQVAKSVGIKRRTLQYRVDHGTSIEDAVQIPGRSK